MRPITAVIILVAGVIGYGAYRGRQAQRAKELRAAAVRDSTRRADSLAYAAIQARMGQQAAAQLGAQQARAQMAATQAAAAAGAAAVTR
jgi:hypothetical protein